MLLRAAVAVSGKPKNISLCLKLMILLKFRSNDIESVNILDIINKWQNEHVLSVARMKRFHRFSKHIHKSRNRWCGAPICHIQGIIATLTHIIPFGGIPGGNPFKHWHRLEVDVNHHYDILTPYISQSVMSCLDNLVQAT